MLVIISRIVSKRIVKEYITHKVTEQQTKYQKHWSPKKAKRERKSIEKVGQIENNTKRRDLYLNASATICKWERYSNLETKIVRIDYI